MTDVNGNTLLLGPAERADLIVDFTNVLRGEYVLANIGPDEPFAGGVSGLDFEVADPSSTGKVMQFPVGPAVSPDPTTPPVFLVLPPIEPLEPAGRRSLALLEQMSEHFEDAPAEARLGTIAGDPRTGPAKWTALKWEDAVTENPAVGAVEMWELYNGTGDAHPMHIHEGFFQLVDRQDVLVNEEGETFEVAAGSEPIPPRPWENGWKDTVIAYPGQVTRIKMKFERAGQFVWHCHIVEHEDNEMMRPYRIGPVQPGQPGPDGVRGPHDR
jgi:FtsP/CotA-like multicopper oxidase with cupredoxin domain